MIPVLRDRLVLLARLGLRVTKVIRVLSVRRVLRAIKGIRAIRAIPDLRVRLVRRDLLVPLGLRVLILRWLALLGLPVLPVLRDLLVLRLLFPALLVLLVPLVLKVRVVMCGRVPPLSMLHCRLRMRLLFMW